MIKLILKDIFDPYILENFVRLQSFIFGEVILMAGFKFFEVSFDTSVTNFKFKHNLGFLPKDIIVTSVTNGATIVFNYELITKDFLDITTSGATTIRFLVGSMKNTVQ